MGRRLLGVALVAIVVVSAGCAGLGQEAPTAAGTPASGPATDGTDAAAAQAPATNESAASTAGGTVTEHVHGGDANGTHDHGGSDRASNGSDAVPVNGSFARVRADAETAGKLTVVVDGTELDLATLDGDDGFDVTASDEHTWTAANESMTLARALSTFGLEARANALTHDGVRYDASTNGTTLTYRVDGTPVDPTAHEVRDGDRIWVVVETARTDAATPGHRIDVTQQHVHGRMNVTVDGTSLDFSREKFQANDRYFHYEGGNGEFWHAHSWGVTLEYGLSSLADVEADANNFAYDGTTYGEANATITYAVNGRSVDPGEYLLKDGDAIEVTVEAGN